MYIENYSIQLKKRLDFRGTNICVFPYGEIGRQCVSIMRDVYAIDPHLILDNHICDFNPKVKALDYLNEINTVGLVCIFATTNMHEYESLKEKLDCYFEIVIELKCNIINGLRYKKRRTELADTTTDL